MSLAEIAIIDDKGYIEKPMDQGTLFDIINEVEGLNLALVKEEK